MSDGYWKFEFTLPISEAEAPKLQELYAAFAEKKMIKDEINPKTHDPAAFASEISIGDLDQDEFTPQVFASGFVFTAGDLSWKDEGTYLSVDNAEGEWCDPSKAAEFLQLALIELGRDDVVKLSARLVPFEDPDFEDMDEDEVEAWENGEFDEVCHYSISKDGIEQKFSDDESTPPTP